MTNMYTAASSSSKVLQLPDTQVQVGNQAQHKARYTEESSMLCEPVQINFTSIEQIKSQYLYRAGECWVTGSIGCTGVAAITQLVDQVPGKDSGLILVLATIESVGAVHNGGHMVLVELDDCWVSKEVPSGH